MTYTFTPQRKSGHKEECRGLVAEREKAQREEEELGDDWLQGVEGGGAASGGGGGGGGGGGDGGGGRKGAKGKGKGKAKKKGK